MNVVIDVVPPPSAATLRAWRREALAAQNAVGMPINDVKQSGDKVEFGLKIAHTAFQ